MLTGRVMFSVWTTRAHIIKLPKGKKNGQNRNGQQKKSTWVTTTGEDSQQGEERLDDENLLKPPAYSQGDLINSIRALNMNTCNKLMDQLMDELGF